MDGEDGLIGDLQQRLLRHPAERYPVQHATTQYHLGVALANLGRLKEAEPALRRAAELFEPGLPVEHAKATNSLGAVLRMDGRHDEAAAAFEAAAGVFASEGLELEEGAARYNLGLVLRERGDEGAAVGAFRRAVELLSADRVPSQAAAAHRELGTSLLVSGAVDDALDTLARAEALADRAGDAAGLGAAANALGLGYLGAGRTEDAIEAFRRAVGGNPRSVRPDTYAMAKANLALAHERARDAARARLAALQANGTPGAPEPVREQAQGVLERVGREPGALTSVLRDEARESWAAVVREEAIRWADADEVTRSAEVAAWVSAHLEAAANGPDLAEALLAGLLELPPEEMELLIGAVVETAAALGEEDRRRLRAETEMAMARFHVPQLMRLKDTFARVARERGLEAAWR